MVAKAQAARKINGATYVPGQDRDRVSVEFTGGAKRPGRPHPKVMQALETVANKTLPGGSRVIVYSGTGEHGSSRHRASSGYFGQSQFGIAADVQIVLPGGKRAGPDTMKRFGQGWAQHTKGGVGYGRGYMGVDRMHVDLVTQDLLRRGQGMTWGGETGGWNLAAYRNGSKSVADFSDQKSPRLTVADLQPTEIAQPVPRPASLADVIAPSQAFAASAPRGTNIRPLEILPRPVPRPLDDAAFQARAGAPPPPPPFAEVTSDQVAASLAALPMPQPAVSLPVPSNGRPMPNVPVPRPRPLSPAPDVPTPQDRTLSLAQLAAAQPPPTSTWPNSGMIIAPPDALYLEDPTAAAMQANREAGIGTMPGPVPDLSISALPLADQLNIMEAPPAMAPALPPPVTVAPPPPVAATPTTQPVSTPAPPPPPTGMDVWQGRSDFGVTNAAYDGGPRFEMYRQPDGDIYRYSEQFDRTDRIGADGSWRGNVGQGRITGPLDGGSIQSPDNDNRRQDNPLMGALRGTAGGMAGGMAGSALGGPIGGILGAALGRELASGGDGPISRALNGNRSGSVTGHGNSSTVENIYRQREREAREAALRSTGRTSFQSSSSDTRSRSYAPGVRDAIDNNRGGLW